MTLKQFTTAARSAPEEAPAGEPLDVEIDGRKVTLLPPTTGQLAIAMIGGGDMATQGEQIATSINFFFGLLEEKDAKFFRRRLFDRDDSFDVEQIADICEYATEEWFGRPTKQPSDFLPSQHGSGKKSTAKRHKAASTRSG